MESTKAIKLIVKEIKNKKELMINIIGAKLSELINERKLTFISKEIINQLLVSVKYDEIIDDANEFYYPALSYRDDLECSIVQWFYDNIFEKYLKGLYFLDEYKEDRFLIFKENTLNWLCNGFLDISIENFINNNK